MIGGGIEVNYLTKICLTVEVKFGGDALNGYEINYVNFEDNFKCLHF